MIQIQCKVENLFKKSAKVLQYFLFKIVFPTYSQIHIEKTNSLKLSSHIFLLISQPS